MSASTLTMSTSPPTMSDYGDVIPTKTGTECIMLPIDDSASRDGIDNLVMAGGGDMKFGGSEC